MGSAADTERQGAHCGKCGQRGTEELGHKGLWVIQKEEPAGVIEGFKLRGNMI